MANYRAVANGNWSAGATWGGGAVPPNGEAHNIYSNNFTVTIDQNVDVNLITNASNAGTFVGGGTAAAGGGFTMSAAFDVAGTLTGASQLLTISATTGTININSSSINGATATGTMRHNGAANIVVNNCNIIGAGGGSYVNIVNASSGNMTFNNCTITANASGGGAYPIFNNSSSGILSFNSCTITGGLNSAYAVGNNSSGGIIASSCVITGGGGGGAGEGIYSISNGTVTCQNSTINGGSGAAGLRTAAASTLIVTNCNITASNGANGITALNTSLSGTRINGLLIGSANGFQAVYSPRFITGTQPLNSYIQISRDGITSFDRFYTADNSLGQANPTDVRSGVSYASGNLTGRLTVPARGSVALSVNYGPSMPFTATRSGTTATATLTYSYPLVVGDQITVTGASNSEWNSTYTIASVVSGTSVTFVVPATHSATAGTGALMQTTGTAVLDPAAVASAVWGAATRTITGGVVDTLTNAPSVPSAATIASQVRTELATELARVDQNISSRLAAADYNAPTSAPTAASV